MIVEARSDTSRIQILTHALDGHDVSILCRSPEIAGVRLENINRTLR